MQTHKAQNPQNNQNPSTIQKHQAQNQTPFLQLAQRHLFALHTSYNLAPPPPTKLLNNNHKTHFLKYLLMKFRTLALIFALFGSTFAFAEESGFFIGVNYGYGEFKQVSSGSFDLQGTPIATGKETIKTDSFSTGFLVGYKYFFNPFVGLRLYAGLDVSVPEFEADGEKEDATLISYGGNLDLLVNFLSQEKVDFGLFVGAGVGANQWISKDIEEAKRDSNFKDLGIKFRDIGLDIALNAGLRVSIARQHGIEIGVRVPFKPVTMFDKSLENGGVRLNMKLEYVQMYNVFGRYTFSF